MKELERKYLERNSIYYIENTLLSTINNQDIREFVWDLYIEYKSVKDNFKAKILKEINSFSNLSELEIYFIIQLNNKLTYEWERTNELEGILKKFETRILRNNYKESWIKTSYIPIDVNTISIIDVISRYISIPDNLKKNIKCPLWHWDRTPSFRIYSTTNSYYCFSCQSWWSSINFISAIENVSNKEAFKIFKNLFFNNKKWQKHR